MPMVHVCVFVCVCVCVCTYAYKQKGGHICPWSSCVYLCVCVCVCVRTGRAVSRADLGLFYCKSCCLLLQKLVFFFETFAAARERALRVQFRVLIVCGCTCHHDNCVRLFFFCTHYYYLLYYDHYYTILCLFLLRLLPMFTIARVRGVRASSCACC